jgi:hypothetical protein
LNELGGNFARDFEQQSIARKAAALALMAPVTSMAV